VTGRVVHPATEDDAGLRQMLAPLGAPDYTALASLVEAGRLALGQLAVDTARQDAPIRAGLSVWARLSERADALVAWAGVAADLPWDADLQDADNVAAVLRGLLPGLTPEQLERHGDMLTDAAERLAGLVAHERAGTTPHYPPLLGGMPAEAALAADMASATETLNHVAAWLAARWDGRGIGDDQD